MNTLFKYRHLGRNLYAHFIALFIFIYSDISYAQQVITIELPAAQRFEDVRLKEIPRTRQEQRQLFLSKTDRIRSHHRPVPLNETVAPFAADLTSRRAIITPRTAEAMLKNNIDIKARRSVSRLANLNYNYASPISEPTVGSRGDEILVTGNWYAALSLDGGASFKSLDPFSMFATQHTETAFCCDQIAAYDRDMDAMVWLMQGTANKKGNFFRLLVATGRDDIRNNNWFFYDLSSSALLQRDGSWFDFPDLAFSEEYIYLTSNIFSIDTDEWEGAMVVRIDKTALASYKRTTANAVFVGTGSLRLTQGAKERMYWAGHNSSSDIQLWSWGDNEDTPRPPARLVVERWNRLDTDNIANAVAPNKRPWLKRADGRITAGWKTGGQIGFAWTVGADNRFKYPHVRAAIVDETSLANPPTVGSIKPVRQPHIWSNAFAIAYPAAAPSSEGLVGISVAFGGPKNYPSHAVGILPKDLSVPLTLTVTSKGKNTPICPKSDGSRDYECGVWGDYFSVRPHGSQPDTWVTIGYTLRNRDSELVKAEAEYFWFGALK